MYKRWRVYSTFFTGLCIGLGYALLIGNPLPLGLDDAALLIEWKVLVLAFSGILGGVIYTIVINGEVEMPRFSVTQGGVFKAGLFGDILLGIAGAFILELMLPTSLSVMAERVEEGAVVSATGTAIAATGIIGGYGGRAIIKFSLERFFKYTGALDEVREAAITGRSRPAETAEPTSISESPADIVSSENSTTDEHTLSLIEQVDRFIQLGLSERGQLALMQQLQAEPTAVHREVSTALVDLRQEIASSPNAQFSNEQLQRMIEVFNVLVGASPNEHPFYRHLGVIHTEVDPPAYDKALAALGKAIALRGPLTIGQPQQHGLYELDRAVANIQQGHAATEDFTIPAAIQDAILKDLLTLSQVYNIDPILEAADQRKIPTPVVNWIRHNQALITEQEEAKPVMDALRSMVMGNRVVGNRLRPIGSSSTSSTPVSAGATDSPDLDIHSGSAPTLGQPNRSPANQEAVFPENFSALGRCYDILYLDPFNILGDKSAKATQVFDFYSHEAVERLDEKESILIPKGTQYTPGSTGKMEVSSQTQLLYTESDVQKMFAGQLGAAFTQLLGAVFPFSLSTSYASYKSDRTVEKNVYAFTKAEYLHFTLAIDSLQSADLHLNEVFRQAVARLPLISNYEYLNFINDFGTHTATKVDFGGLFHHSYCLNQSTYESLVQSGGDVSIRAQLAFEAKYENKHEGSTLEEFSDSSEISIFCGGEETENIHDWFGTIKDDPAPIHVELVPLYELLESSRFPEDKQIIKKRTLLEAAVRNYLKENSQPPAWELWPSAAVGGNGGGVFFDINLEPIRLPTNKARYETARVKEVHVWIDGWVERVQMILEGDMPPLKGHGNEDGNLHVLKLEPDDYITGVSVKAGAPQKIFGERGPYVGAIRIQTHKEKDWWVGTQDNSAIALDVPEGYQVIGFHGRYGKHIDKLGVISIPVIK